MNTTKNKALRTLSHGVIAIVTTGALLLGLSALFQPKNNQQAFGMTNEAANGVMGERENSIDVLFIGDSEAFSSFSPLQMWNERGFTSYVCATSSQQLPYGNTLLQRATEKQKPRVVVIETNTIYAPFSTQDAAMRTAQDAFSVLEFHNRWKTLTGADLTNEPSTTYSDELKGFRINKDVKAADASNHMAPSPEVQQIPEINRLYLQSMIDYCREIGATPVLVSTPSTVNWNMARHNGISAFAQEAGVEYIDMNIEPNKVDIDWATETHDGGDHLNLAGATKVSSTLGKYLSEKHALPDHRNDATYQSWNESYERYKTKL